MRAILCITTFFCLYSIAISQSDRITALNRAIAENSSDFAAVEGLVEIFVDHENYKSADSVLSEYLKNDPQHPKAVYLQARILDLSGNIEKAMSKYWETIGLDSTLWQAYRDLAYLYDIFSGYETMNRLLKKAMFYAPAPESLYYDFGYSFDMMGWLDSAQHYYYRAVNFDSLDHQACLNLGAIMGIGGNLDSAKYYTQMALAGNLDSPEAFYNLGEINLSLGLFNEAAGNFQHSLALNSNLFAAKKKLGDLYEIMGDSGMARTYYEDFLDSAPIIYIDDINEVRQKLSQYK
jgi:tetratricopeptide (TPR) repeat protein